MRRREFIHKGVSAGLMTGIALGFGKLDELMAVPSADRPVDLVAVKGGEPDVMFDKAIAALGGMSLYVKKGQKVVVKPNIGWDKKPEMGANTNPLLVKRIVEQCFGAGASEVYVFDYTCNDWRKCYQNSGIREAVEKAGGKMVPANDESYYVEVKIPEGKKLKNEKVHRLVLETDVFINVPVLKHHGGGVLSIAMKNLMGIAWGRGQWHKIDLQQCIADFSTYHKSTLNVIDAYRVMKTHGPQGVSENDTVLMKSLLISPNAVIADAAAAKLWGMEPEKVPHIRIAGEMGIGTIDLEKINIVKIKV